MTTRNVQLKVMGNLALDVKHGYRTSMSKTSHANTTVAVVCNPTSNKGKGAQVGGHVIDLLRGAGRKHGFDVIDVTGTSFEIPWPTPAAAATNTIIWSRSEATAWSR